MNELVLDPTQACDVFPPIHAGRYEVDPWAAGVRLPLSPGLADAAHRAGISLVRIGIGCWLPGHDPDESNHAEREWFRGSTIDDVDDPAMYNFTHLDRNLDVCIELGVDLLLSFDFMPRSLARPGGPKAVIDEVRPYEPPGYEFPDGIRDAPTTNVDVLAMASVRVLDHVRERGVTVRYVELWNEPDLPFFYSGTYPEYFPMYAAFARAVHDAGYRVGGPSWAGVLEAEEWLDQFLADCAATGTPLDFYSFHRYNDSVDTVLQRCHEIRRALDRSGFAETEALLDEWGYDLRQPAYFGTVGNAAFTASCLMQLPDAGIAAQTHVLLVDPVEIPELGRLHGLTDRHGSRNPIAYCLEAFEDFQRTPHRIRTAADHVVLAGADPSGTRIQVIMANPNPDSPSVFRVSSPVPIVAELRRLTTSSFAEGGWSDPQRLVIDQSPIEVVIDAETMARLDGQVMTDARAERESADPPAA